MADPETQSPVEEPPKTPVKEKEVIGKFVRSFKSMCKKAQWPACFLRV